MNAVAPIRHQMVVAHPQVAEALTAIKSLVLNSVRSPHTRRSYDHALTEFLIWCSCGEGAAFTKANVQRYRAELEAGIGKVPGARSEGPRAGNWLTRDQASRLLALPDPETVKGKRDRAILALLLACGVRRDELVRLSVEEIQLREGRWVLVDLLGNGRKRRTVPVPSWVKASIDEWMTAAGVEFGCVFRAINKGGRVYGDGLTANVIWSIVQGYAAQIGVPQLAPHDLRRTCTKLCRAAGGDLEQIQLLLGHASIATTERYLGSRLDLVNAVNDDLGLDS